MFSLRIACFAILAFHFIYPAPAIARSVSVAVVGDSLANDLANGMEDNFAGKPVNVIKLTQFATGLVRTDYFNWNGTVQNALRHGDANIVIVVLGGNDHQSIRIDGRRLDPLTKEWRAEYARRVGHFMDTIGKSRGKLYWVGLPDVRSDKLGHGYRVMNAIYKREAAKRKLKYIDIWGKFHGKDSAYSSFGMSLEGVKRQIRKDDGMHFTEAGRRVFADYVSRAIGLR